MGLLDGARGFMEKLGYFGDAEEEQEEDLPAEAAEEDEEEEERESGGLLFGRFGVGAVFGRRKNEAFRDAAEEPGPRAAEARSPARDNVIRDERLAGRAPSAVVYHKEHVVTVYQIEECREIIKCLLRGESVLLNLENVDPKDSGRIVDLLSGAAFALQGRMIKIAHLAYLLAPQNVEILEDSRRAGTAQSQYR